MSKMVKCYEVTVYADGKEQFSAPFTGSYTKLLVLEATLKKALKTQFPDCEIRVEHKDGVK